MVRTDGVFVGDFELPEGVGVGVGRGVVPGPTLSRGGVVVGEMVPLCGFPGPRRGVGVMRVGPNGGTPVAGVGVFVKVNGDRVGIGVGTVPLVGTVTGIGAGR